MVMNRNLEIFIKVAESGSITRTAKTMYITQPAVSNAISKLETGLNVKLFYRDRHNGMILTEVGHKFEDCLPDFKWRQCSRKSCPALQPLIS